jgi:WD40 repeat protein
LWAAASGERLQTLSHEGSVIGAAWNGDESQILTWSRDGTAKIWAAQSGQPLRIITPDDSPITAAKWNQNEDRLLIATEGGIAKIYYTDMDDLTAAACQSATRNFNWGEWQLYFPGEPYRQICPDLPPHPSVPQEAIES